VKFQDSSGAVLTLAKKLGEGGEGTVFTTHEKPDVVAKLYAQPLTALQLAKLEAMVQANDATLRSVAAWPIALLHKGSRPVGFTMPLLASQSPLHDLIGPKRRQDLFPHAHWKFLIHTAINLARSFEVLHGRGVVVGDVNSSNIFVHRDSMTHLIDCDSFQIAHNGSVLRCNVGVAEYQPPELQNHDLSRIDRLPQHDLFGLAVMIFQLLFVGKHPFAGVLPAHIRNNGAIGDNVAAKRFFYGQHAIRNGLRPPPGALNLHAITPQMSAYFMQAFLGEPATRPPASAWRTTLEDLESKTIPCSVNAIHRYLQGTRCPWCALERGGLYYFVLDTPGAAGGGIDDSFWQQFGDAEISKVWAEISAIQPPPQVSDKIPRLTETPKPRPLSLWSKERRWAYAAGAAAFVAGVVTTIVVGVPILSTFVLLTALGLAALFRPDARAEMAKRNRRYKEAKHAYASVAKEWSRAARNTRFIEAREHLVHVKRQLQEQKARYKSELTGLGKRRARKELEAFLERHVIAAHHIADIGKKTQALLLSFGIETAADVTDAKLARVPTLSNERKQHLIAWRKSIERRFRFNPKGGVDQRILRELVSRHMRERRTNQAKLSSGALELRRIVSETARQRPALQKLVKERAAALRAAEADTNILPLFYRM
jgi:DNA-binding helix-hairpin-helix protein with protein kinase domain